MKTETVRARVEPALKNDVESILSTLGLSMSQAIELYLWQIKLKHGIPFDVRIPNEVTKATFSQTDRGEELKEYSSMDELFKNLDD
jgi:DNA-damage-inducible protein J